MTTTTPKLAHPSQEEGYIGEFWLLRKGETELTRMIFAISGSDGKLHYRDDRNFGVFLKPQDRKTATLVMEDNENQEAFRSVLLADRWVNVVGRG